MSNTLGRIDIDQRILNRAEEITQKRYGMSFDDLPSCQQMNIFMEAEQQVREAMNETAEMLVEARREYYQETEKTDEDDIFTELELNARLEK